jgi:hypothetical protein
MKPEERKYEFYLEDIIVSSKYNLFFKGWM